MRVFWQRKKAVAMGAALALVLAGLTWAQSSKSSANPPVHLKVAAESHGPAVTNRLGFAPVVKEVLPAVVSITSTKVIKTSGRQQQINPFAPFFGDQFGEDFGQQFGQQFQMPRNQRESGLGSGVILSPDGYIITNNHVVDGANNVTVTLSDKREFKARVVGTDPQTDIAVVKIDASNLPVATIGDSDKIEVGDFALAIGNPFGIGETVTMGIVSATRRSGLGIEEREDFIQTDAPINPGNSGGALVNDRGELIGINTAIVARGSSGNQGIGFAVPVNLARNIMDQLVKSGKVTRAYLGIYPQDLTPGVIKAMNLKNSEGALVAEVTEGTPAERAGLKSGDVITEVNGKPVTDANQLRNMISSMAPDSTVNVKIVRDGNPRTVSVTLGELPKEEATNRGGRGDRGRNRGSNQESGQVIPGISVDNMTPQTARQLGVSASSGVVVTDVDPDSAAAEGGLKEGDVIQEVNHQPVHNVSEFERAVRNSNQGNLLLVNRDGRKLFVGV